MPQCPQCRGDLIEDTGNSTWRIVFSTLTTIAAGLETDSFVVDVVLDDDSTYDQELGESNGTIDGDRTEYVWEIDSAGTAVSGILTVEHSTLDTFEQALKVTSV